MPDPFQPYDLDSERGGAWYELFEKRGAFWYFTCTAGGYAAAKVMAARLAAAGNAVAVEQVIRRPMFRLEPEAVLEATAG